MSKSRLDGCFSIRFLVLFALVMWALPGFGMINKDSPPAKALPPEPVRARGIGDTSNPVRPAFFEDRADSEGSSEASSSSPVVLREWVRPGGAVTRAPSEGFLSRGRAQKGISERACPDLNPADDILGASSMNLHLDTEALAKHLGVDSDLVRQFETFADVNFMIPGAFDEWDQILQNNEKSARLVVNIKSRLVGGLKERIERELSSSEIYKEADKNRVRETLSAITENVVDRFLEREFGVNSKTESISTELIKIKLNQFKKHAFNILGVVNSEHALSEIPGLTTAFRQAQSTGDVFGAGKADGERKRLRNEFDTAQARLTPVERRMYEFLRQQGVIRRNLEFRDIKDPLNLNHIELAVTKSNFAKVFEGRLLPALRKNSPINSDKKSSLDLEIEARKPAKAKTDDAIEKLLDEGQKQRAYWQYRLGGNEARAKQILIEMKQNINEHFRQNLPMKVKKKNYGKNKSSEITLDDGTRLLFKPNSGLKDSDVVQDRDNLHAAPFASFVHDSLKLNILPLSFNGEFRGEKGSFILMVPKALDLGEYHGLGVKTGAGRKDKEQAELVKIAPPGFNLFHFLSLDGDHFQHGGNDMVTFGQGANNSLGKHFFTIDPGQANTPFSANQFAALLRNHEAKDLFIRSLTENQDPKALVKNLEAMKKEAKVRLSQAQKGQGGFFHDDPEVNIHMGEFFIQRLDWVIQLARGERFDLAHEYEEYWKKWRKQSEKLR